MVIRNFVKEADEIHSNSKLVSLQSIISIFIIFNLKKNIYLAYVQYFVFYGSSKFFTLKYIGELLFINDGSYFISGNFLSSYLLIFTLPTLTLKTKQNLISISKKIPLCFPLKNKFPPNQT